MTFLRRHRLLAGSVAIFIAVLVFVPAVWRIQVEGHSRSGQAWHISMAGRGLWIAGAGVAMYALAGLGVPVHWGMRPPTDGEVSVARWLMRALGLAALWVAIYATVP